MERDDGTHIVVSALQSSLSLLSRLTMHSAVESAEMCSTVELSLAGGERPVSFLTIFQGTVNDVNGSLFDNVSK